jgi:hypothetical protein
MRSAPTIGGIDVSTSIRLRVSALSLLTLVVAALSVAVAPASHASCIGNPVPSPYTFSGVVERTDLGQRIAHVRTDDGRDVVVRGTSATAENMYTTVDRTYFTGHRYVFHPVNGTNPYEDNICTLTYDLGPEPTERARAESETALADDSDSEWTSRTWLLAGAVVGVALIVGGVALMRRARAAGLADPAWPDSPS